MWGRRYRRYARCSIGGYVSTNGSTYIRLNGIRRATVHTRWWRRRRRWTVARFCRPPASSYAQVCRSDTNTNFLLYVRRILQKWGESGRRALRQSHVRSSSSSCRSWRNYTSSPSSGRILLHYIWLIRSLIRVALQPDDRFVWKAAAGWWQTAFIISFGVCT